MGMVYRRLRQADSTINVVGVDSGMLCRDNIVSVKNAFHLASWESIKSSLAKIDYLTKLSESYLFLVQWSGIAAYLH